MSNDDDNENDNHNNNNNNNNIESSSLQIQQQQQDIDVYERARELYKGEGLAPMVRASTISLRLLALQYGADFVYTEEFVDRAISSNCKRIENKELGTIDYIREVHHLSKKQLRKNANNAGKPLVILRIDPKKERGKLIGQLGTGEADLALEAASILYKDVDGIDINMGCPKKFSTSGGMGSALLDDPQRASSIIRTLRSTFSNKPISCKIRLLQDTKHTLDFCEAMIQTGGTCAIAIHARCVGTRDVEKADWKTLIEVVSILKSKYPQLPILINGDFYTRNELTEVISTTLANGVLLGRPALYNTSIFRKPTNDDDVVSSYSYNSPLLFNKTKVIQDYLNVCLEYQQYYKNVKYVICEMMNHKRTPSERIKYMPQRYNIEQTIGNVCKCKSLQDLCQIWNVKTTSSCGIVAKTTQTEDGRRYDDSYILQRMQEKPTSFVSTDGKKGPMSTMSNNDGSIPLKEGVDEKEEPDFKRIKHA